MSYRFVLNQLGLLLMVLSAILGVIAAACAGGRALGWPVERAEIWALLASCGVGAAFGGALLVLFRKEGHLGRREALFLVALSWLGGAAFAALPFIFWAYLAGAEGHPFRNYIDCYFEAMSGLSTTGSTVLSDIGALPDAILFWRALTQWLGGLGIVVLFVAVLPSLGVGGKKLFRVESSGPKSEGLQPQIRETARALWYVYLCLTALQIVALWLLGGMSIFDASCHALTTMSTAGFSTQDASLGAYGHAARLITIVFMILAGINFGLYYQLYRGRVRTVMNDVELRLYLILLAVGTAIVFVALTNGPKVIQSTTGEVLETTTFVAAEEAIFTTVSVQTTTGFCTSDFNPWPFAAQAVLILLMVVGGSSGSTSGGIKVIRVWITFKVMIAEIERVYRPNVIRPVRVGGGHVDPDVKLGSLAYALGTIVVFLAGSAVVMLLEGLAGHDCSYTTASTASISAIFTIGPGLDAVGATSNYGWMSGGSKLVLALLMALGRLEIFAIIVLFTRRFWLRD